MNDKKFNNALDSNKFPSVIKEAQRFFFDQGLPNLPIHTDRATGWRCRAKLAVRGTIEDPLIGLFKEGTHDVVDIPNCEDHHPRINEAVEWVRKIIKNEKIKPYDEKSSQGTIRYLQFVVHRPTNKVQLAIVLNHETGSEKQFPWLEKLWNEGKEDLWHSIWLNFNAKRTNTIFGTEWKHCFGPEWLWETFDQTSVCFHPSSFGQANLDLFEKMIVHLKTIVPHQTLVAEYYAGVGVIGLCLANQIKKIDCCEINPMAKICFDHSKSRLDPIVGDRMSFHEGLAGNRLDLLDGSEVVIVDPPRKGLDAPLLKGLKETNGVKQIVYISCGWDSFQKDCLELLAGGWKIQEAHIYLFFPGTNHIETLTVFERVKQQE